MQWWPHLATDERWGGRLPLLGGEPAGGQEPLVGCLGRVVLLADPAPVATSMATSDPQYRPAVVAALRYHPAVRQYSSSSRPRARLSAACSNTCFEGDRRLDGVTELASVSRSMLRALAHPQRRG